MKFFPLTQLTKKQRISLFLGTAGFLAVACLVVILLNVRGITVTSSLEGVFPQQDTSPERNLFTGELLVNDAEQQDQRVACVMVENSADAWPLSGIEDAFLVIEAPVEGSIPRFVACFLEGEEVAEIGPVRSARPYYISWVSGFQHALYAHVGGSPEALNILAANKYIHDLNEFWNGASFWRDTDTRFAPHNVYTSTEQLWSAADRLQVLSAASPGWTYQSPSFAVGDICMPLTIHWGNATSYDVIWSCDEATRTYVRLQGNRATVSRDNDMYRATNIAVIEAGISVIDEVGRREIITEGTGNAIVCSAGVCRDAIWHKEGVDKPLQFFTSYPDEPIIFAPGNTWIEVVQDLAMTE